MRALAILLISIFFLTSLTGVASGASPEELRQSIDEKTKELEQITSEVKQKQAQLDQISEEKRTLNSDVKQMDYSISQLNLSIRSSEISIEKMQLELELFQGKRVETEGSIDIQKEAIARVLREIQQKDGEGVMYVLLRGDSLADGLFEIQSLQDLQNNLSLNVSTLTELHNELKQNIDVTTATKDGLEVENTNFKNRKVIVSDKKTEKNTLLSSTKNKESAYQKQLDELENKQAAIGKEIDELETNLRASFDPNVLPFKRSGVLAYPVLNPVVTQEYGATAFAQRAYKTKFHNGIDFKATIGDPIIAADNGSIMAVGDNGRVQYGKYVVVKHDNNLATLYAHLSRVVVSKRDYVKVGQIIGYAGNTGYVTGPHLHFGVYWAPSITLQSFSGAGMVPVGVTINPEDYL